MGGEERSDVVGIFVAEKWVDSVVSVDRHSKIVLILKMVLDNGLLNVLWFMLLTQGNRRRKKRNTCSHTLIPRIVKAISSTVNQT